MSPKNEFYATTRPDLWKSTLHHSQSHRTQDMNSLMRAKPKYEDFSKNGYLKYYKQNLVKSRNVDKIIPFKHSLK